MIFICLNSFAKRCSLGDGFCEIRAFSRGLALTALTSLLMSRGMVKESQAWRWSRLMSLVIFEKYFLDVGLLMFVVKGTWTVFQYIVVFFSDGF